MPVLAPPPIENQPVAHDDIPEYGAELLNRARALLDAHKVPVSRETPLPLIKGVATDRPLKALVYLVSAMDDANRRIRSGWIDPAHNRSLRDTLDVDLLRINAIVEEYEHEP